MISLRLFPRLALYATFLLGTWIHADVLHVMTGTPGGDDGLTWDTAFDELSSALAAAQAGDEIWVARGTYRPGPAGDRTATFTLPDGVSVLGGFGGYEADRSYRVAEPEYGHTILSGDLAGDDATESGGRADNAFHIVTSDQNPATTLLDGFILEGGMADGTGTLESDGGGLIALQSSAQFRNLLVRDNESLEDGGGIKIRGGDTRFVGVTFLGNRAGVRGGGLDVELNGTVATFTNCRFLGNACRLGAGFYVIGAGTNLTFRNTVFLGNAGTSQGAGFFASGGANVFLDHVTMTQNAVRTSGSGAFAMSGGADVVLRNSIVWNNGDIAPEIAVNVGTTVTYESSWILDEGAPDPLFWDVDGPDDAIGTLDDLPRLRSNSPALGTADPALVPADEDDLDGDSDTTEDLPLDLAGGRRQNGNPEPGAFEWNVLYVDAGATGANPDGLSWDGAYPDLQDALAQAGAGDEIWVAAGLYTPAGSGGDPNMIFSLPAGVGLYGGFEGAETARSDRHQDLTTAESVLSGDLNRDDTGTLLENAGDNAHRVVELVQPGARTVLDGFTITGGNNGSQGGGLNVGTNGVFALVERCRFVGNFAGSAGGGARVAYAGQAIFTNCAFLANGGGGVLSFQPHPEFINCAFVGNQGGLSGAFFANGDFNHGPSFPALINCTFVANEAPNYPTYVMFNGSSPELRNTIIWDDRKSSPTYSPAPSADRAGRNLVRGGSTVYPEFLDSDPRFLRMPDPGDGDWATLADNDYGDLRLQPSSPAIDAGVDAANPTPFDLLGNSRRQALAIDLGAQEGATLYQFAILYPNLPPNNDLNGDGFSNYEHYARGIDPAVAIDPTAASELVVAGGEAALNFTIRTNAADVIFSLRHSSNLQDWVPLTAGVTYEIVSETVLDDQHSVFQASLDAVLASDSVDFWQPVYSSIPD